MSSSLRMSTALAMSAAISADSLTIDTQKLRVRSLIVLVKCLVEVLNGSSKCLVIINIILLLVIYVVAVKIVLLVVIISIIVFISIDNGMLNRFFLYTLYSQGKWTQTVSKMEQEKIRSQLYYLSKASRKNDWVKKTYLFDSC